MKSSPVDNENYTVITVTLNPEAEAIVHSYGPYTQVEAYRMRNHFKSSGVIHCFARKLQKKNEVTARPKTPKG